MRVILGGCRRPLATPAIQETLCEVNIGPRQPSSLETEVELILRATVGAGRPAHTQQERERERESDSTTMRLESLTLHCQEVRLISI